MVLLATSSDYKNCIKSTNKIPEYARHFKNEWLFIRGINKEFKYFVDNIDEARSGLFKNNRVDTIIKHIKKFLLFQERGKLKDISDFVISKNDIKNLIKIRLIFYNFNQYILLCENYFHEDDLSFIDPYPGFKNIYVYFELFFSKIKYIFEESNSQFIYHNKIDNYSDSDSDSHRKLFGIPKLGKCWEFFPLLGNVWDNIFL